MRRRIALVFAISLVMLLFLSTSAYAWSLDVGLRSVGLNDRKFLEPRPVTAGPDFTTLPFCWINPCSIDVYGPSGYYRHAEFGGGIYFRWVMVRHFYFGSAPSGPYRVRCRWRFMNGSFAYESNQYPRVGSGCSNYVQFSTGY